MNFTKIGYTTNSTYSIAYVSLPPGAGPPPHIHHWNDEWFYFQEGGIEMFGSNEMYSDPNKVPGVGEEPKAYMHRYLTKPGDLIYGPANYVHGYRNEGNVSRLLISIWAPETITRYFFTAGQIFTDPNTVPNVTEENRRLFVSEAPKYGINMSYTWEEFVANWTDDWYSFLNGNAHEKELLELLGNDIVQSVKNQAAPAIKTLSQLSSVLSFQSFL